jgi:hypothetical protein
MAERRESRLAVRWRLIGVSAVAALAVWKFVIRRPAEPERRILGGAGNREGENPGVAFETADWPLAPVALVYAGVLVLLVVSCAVLVVAYPDALPDVGRTVAIAPPGPRLQTNPPGDLQAFRAQEEKRLNSYYWIDKSHGVLHIPIDQAMRELAQTGIAGFPKE